jgi:hypothetical protein
MFLNPALLWGLAAVSAPIIIHLIHRSRIQPQNWGAMMFLEELLAERARSLRLRSLLLLAIRTLMVLFLVLAMLKPAVRWQAGAARSGRERISAVLLLDDSSSMRAGRPRTAWQEAQDLALKYLDELKPGDDVTIVLTSKVADAGSAAALFDLEGAHNMIRNAQPSFTTADMPRAVASALQLLENRHNPRREMVIFSDLQTDGWQLEDGTRWSFIAGARKSSKFPPQVLLAPVMRRKPGNLAVMSVSPSRQVIDPFNEMFFHVKVLNDSDEEVSDVSVTFIVDGAPKTTQTIGLKANEEQVLDFAHRFDRSGSSYVGAKIRAVGDQFEEDNEMYLSVLVMDNLPVLIVDGDRRTGPLESEAAFLSMALAPQDKEDPDWRTVLAPTVVDVTDLRSADLLKYRVIILANVAGLPSSTVSELERFVIGGGGLLVTLGDRVQADAYNRDLFRHGSGLLPVSLGNPVQKGNRPAVPVLTSGAEADPQAERGVHLGQIVTRVAALDLFRPEKGQDWSSARINNYFTTAHAAGDQISVLALYSDGQTAIVQKKVGEGKVTLFTSAVDADWSDLPIQPYYVPLFQSLVLDLASQVVPPRNLSVDQSLSCVATGPLALKPHLLYPPKGIPVALPVQRQGTLSVFSYNQTATPGLYTVAPEGGDTEGRVYYTVSIDRRESKLARLGADELQRLTDADGLGARLVETPEELISAAGTGSGGYPLITHFLLLALCCCFLELYLERRWS